MKLALKLAAGCAILIAAPASAQILGGGGGGGLGGSIGGAGGQLGGTVNGTLGNINQSTRGTADGGANGNVDRRTGRARARARGNGAVDSVTGTRIGSGNLSGRASGDAEVGAQAVGTDAMGGTVSNTRSTARGTVDTARATARGTAGSIRGTTGNASAGANANMSLSGSTANLAAAGSVAAVSGAAIPVSPGMIVRDTSGRVIGRVQSLRARANGVVDNVIVRVGDRLASLPDENFSAHGNVLVSAMSQADVNRAAGAQSGRQGRSISEAQTPRRGGPQKVDRQ